MGATCLFLKSLYHRACVLNFGFNFIITFLFLFYNTCTSQVTVWSVSICCESLQKIAPNWQWDILDWINFPLIFPSYWTPSPFHDKGYFPCCMAKNDQCKCDFIFLFVCFLPLHSFWIMSQYISSQCCTTYCSLFFSLISLECVPETFTYEKCSFQYFCTTSFLYQYSHWIQLMTH